MWSRCRFYGLHHVWQNACNDIDLPAVSPQGGAWQHRRHLAGETESDILREKLIYLWFTQWLLLLTGDTELTKCWALYDVDVKWLPGLTEDSEWQELSRSTSRSYSGSQGSVGITKVYNGPTYMPCINHIVAPVAHWGPRTLKIKSCTWRWYAVASGGSYGSLGTQNTWNGETYITLMYSGSRGSLRTQNERDHLDL